MTRGTDKRSPPNCPATALAGGPLETWALTGLPVWSRHSALSDDPWSVPMTLLGGTAMKPSRAEGRMGHNSPGRDPRCHNSPGVSWGL